MNQIEITDHQVDVLAKALLGLLNTVIDCPCLQETVNKRRRANRLTYESEYLNTKALGDFAHIISEYCVSVIAWINDANEDGNTPIYVTVAFQYTHPDGGSNGHTLDFRIKGNLDGTDLIIVK